MKSILCFGDSLTWGYNPVDKSRFPFEKRWTGIVQNHFGARARVIEEGLNGRTTVRDDPYMPGRNGFQALPMLLESHSPIDVIVLMLGSNDLKVYFNLSADEIAFGCMSLVRLIQRTSPGHQAKSPQILLVSPPHLQEVDGFYGLMFAGRIETSKQLAHAYQSLAERFGCSYLNAAEHAQASSVDGAHLEEAANLKLGQAIARKLDTMLHTL